MSIRSYLAKLNRRDTPLLPDFSKLSKFIFIVLVTVTSIFFASQIFAADSALKQFVDGKKAGGNLERWLGVDSQSINVNGLLNIAVDVETISPDLISGIYPKDGRFFVKAPGGIIGITNQAIAALYTPPASGIEYIAMMKDSFLGKPAYAQGIGFQGLQPILPIWRAFRNVVYIVSSFLFIIIGLMIMLRVKISPQAVISLQNALPQLITALILVTFSYAIAGLIIDMAYLITGIVLAILFEASGKSLATNLFLPGINTGLPFLNNLLNPFNFSNLSDAGIIVVAQLLMIPSLVTIMLGSVVSWLIGFMIALPLGPAAPFVGMITGGLFGSVGAILVTLILIIMINIWLFKFLIGLLKCYATLLFKIIMAPLEIGMGAFPNSKLGFKSWIMGVLANLAVFPVSVLFLVLSNLIIANVIWGGFTGSLSEILKGNLLGGGMWTPQLLGGDVAQFALRPVGGIAAMAIGVSTLLMLSKLPDLITSEIFAYKLSPWGTAMGEAVKQPAGYASAGARFGAQYGSEEQERWYQEALNNGAVPSKKMNLLNALGNTAGSLGIVKRGKK